MREIIRTFLWDIVRKISPGFKEKILVETLENKEFGDYTTNAAFVLAKVIKKSPQEIAQNLVKKINLLAGKQKIKDFSKIEAKNGFINFFLSLECLRHQLKEIIEKPFFAKATKGKKINLEFISANPTGPLTIGNGRGGFYGDALANVLEAQGYKVTREFYINDRGGQISALGRSIKLAQIRRIDSPNRFGESGKGMVRQIENDENKNLYKGEYINELAKKIGKNLNIEETGQKAAELVLKTYIKPVIKKLGIKYDVWFSEKSLYKGGGYEKAMEDLMEKDLIYEKDGATWMKTSSLGDSKDRVLIKSNGDETYFMSDILYHLNKLKTRKFDRAIDIFGADHHGDVPRLLGALKALGVGPERLRIILIQFVRLVSESRELKVSKRAGTFVTLEELIREAGLDAARFFFLAYSPDTHMDFDLALAKERSAKNPVYYVQYAHARISSILKKSQIFPLRGISRRETNIKLLKEKEELNLIRKLIGFPELLEDISKNYEVHRLTRYALELAREFHNFYEKHRVITEDKNITSARLALVSATKIVLKNTLDLMGIDSPNKM